MPRSESAGGGAGIKNARAWVPQSRARPLSGGKLTPRRQLHPEAAAAAAAEKFKRQRADKAAARRAPAAAAGCAERGGLLTGAAERPVGGLEGRITNVITRPDGMSDMLTSCCIDDARGSSSSSSRPPISFTWAPIAELKMKITESEEVDDDDYSVRASAAEYCDEHVCLSDRENISKTATASPVFANFLCVLPMAVVRSCWIMRRCESLCRHHHQAFISGSKTHKHTHTKTKKKGTHNHTHNYQLPTTNY